MLVNISQAILRLESDPHHNSTSILILESSRSKGMESSTMCMSTHHHIFRSGQMLCRRY